MNYEKKYLKYKMKYLELKTGGLFGLKPEPTPLTRYPNTTVSESKEINIDGINMKVDKIVYQKVYLNQFYVKSLVKSHL